MTAVSQQYVYTGAEPLTAQLPDGGTAAVTKGDVVDEAVWGDLSGRPDFKPKPKPAAAKPKPKPKPKTGGTR